MIFVIDFDGTLSPEDTIDKLLEHHADPTWQNLETDWLEGRITARECMQGQIRLVTAEHAALHLFFESIRLDASFPAFCRHVRDFAALAIISDGMDHAIHTALNRHGIESLPVFANRLHFIAPDRLELTFPHLNANCEGGNGVCKCAVAKRMANKHGGPIVLIGDGKSDACLAARADVVFAKGSLIRHCTAADIPFIPFDDFGDVLRVVKSWDMADNALAAAI
jgi:2,3-diketo-5-methylthio-1-phosphopentane phosphatase